MRRCLKMAAEEPQQQKQESLGSDSEGTNGGKDVLPGLAGASLDRPFPRSSGSQDPGDWAQCATEPFTASFPLPLTMEAGPRRPPAGRGGQGRGSASRARLGRGLGRPSSAGPAPSAGSHSQPA